MQASSWDPDTWRALLTFRVPPPCYGEFFWTFLYEEKENNISRPFIKEMMTVELCVIGVVQEWCDGF